MSLTNGAQCVTINVAVGSCLMGIYIREVAMKIIRTFPFIFGFSLSSSFVNSDFLPATAIFACLVFAPTKMSDKKL